MDVLLQWPNCYVMNCDVQSFRDLLQWLISYVMYCRDKGLLWYTCNWKKNSLLRPKHIFDKLQRLNSWMLYCSDQIVIWWIVISKDFVIYYSDWFLMWCIAGTRVFCDIHVIEKKIHCSDQNIFLINYRDKILGCYIAVTKLLFDELWCPEFSWFITETDFLCDVLQGLQSFVIYMQLKKIFTAQTKTYFW